MARDEIAPALDAGHGFDRVEKTRKRTLGNVRLRHHETNEIILIPTPSSDPNDPLNWCAPFPNIHLDLTNSGRPQWYKYYMATGQFTPKT